MECVQNIVNVTALSEEIGELAQYTLMLLILNISIAEKAKPNGNLDTVFHKYCKRRSEGVDCVDQFAKSLDPCLTTEEKDQKVVFINITKSLLEFVCHDNGNQIARKL